MAALFVFTRLYFIDVNTNTAGSGGKNIGKHQKIRYNPQHELLGDSIGYGDSIVIYKCYKRSRSPRRLGVESEIKQL